MFQVVKGTRDILPEKVEVWQRAERTAHEVFLLYGFREIRTPVLESTDLFRQGLGSDTDVVTKEMYTFLDRKGRSLTLPEQIGRFQYRGSDLLGRRLGDRLEGGEGFGKIRNHGKKEKPQPDHQGIIRILNNLRNMNGL